MNGKGYVMICLAAITGVETVGCMRSAALPPTASMRSSSIPTVTRLPSHSVPLLKRSISPSDWKPQAAVRDWKYIVLHHTASEAGSVESIDRAHKNRTDAAGNHWRGIGYHFVIGNGNGMGDGEIEPTFRWTDQLTGAHAGVQKYNEEGIGIALIGNFDEHSPSSAQLAAAKRLVAVLKRDYGISTDNVVAHRDFRATACPGKYFPMAEISQSVLIPSLTRHTRRTESVTPVSLDVSRFNESSPNAGWRNPVATRRPSTSDLFHHDGA